MTADERKESTSFKVRRSLSRLALAFAALGLGAALLVGSPDGRFAGFMVMALGGTVPLVLGPATLRKYGGIAAAIGIAGVMVLAGSVASSPYRTKARIQAVYDLATRYTEASAAYRERTKSWPARVADLEVPRKPRTVASVETGSNGTITFVLSFPPVKGRTLTFAPTGGKKPTAWTCISTGIEEAYLPAACREKQQR
jgi:hypothetical protein